jgi:hypothetical protein
VYVPARLVRHRREAPGQTSSAKAKTAQKESLVIAEDFAFLFASMLLTLLALIASGNKNRSNAPATASNRDPVNLLKIKQCPQCEKRLPVVALVCESCNYNFLAGQTQPRHKLLPGPEARALAS